MQKQMSRELSKEERELFIAELEKRILAEVHGWLEQWKKEDSTCLYELPFTPFTFGVISGLRILADASHCTTSTALLNNIANFMLNNKGDSPS
jgi:hypothetical protein